MNKYLRNHRLGNTVRNISRFYIRGFRYSRDWPSLLSEGDAALIGGGQLIMDNALDSPLKLNRVARLAYRLGKDVFFLSCGVAENWSYAASKLFERALMPASRFTVRDTLSLEGLEKDVPAELVRPS